MRIFYVDASAPLPRYCLQSTLLYSAVWGALAGWWVSLLSFMKTSAAVNALEIITLRVGTAAAVARRFTDDDHALLVCR